MTHIPSIHILLVRTHHLSAGSTGMKNAIPGLGGPSSSVAEGGVQIRGQSTFSATCHSRLKMRNLREMDLLKQRSLYMVVLRPEVSSVCLINSSFPCAAQPLPGASHLLLAEEKGWNLTLKLWLHQPHALSRLKGLRECWKRLLLQSMEQNGGKPDYEQCLRSQQARC